MFSTTLFSALARLRFSALLASLLLVLLSIGSARAADDFLDPEKAFEFSANVVSPTQLQVKFKIADGYYLYGEQFKFSADGATLGAPAVPKGKIKFDETFKKNVESHRGELLIALPVSGATAPFKLTVRSQGCADKGLCYPPMESFAMVTLATSNVTVLTEEQAAAKPSAVSLPGITSNTQSNSSASTSIAQSASAAATTAKVTPANEEGKIGDALRSGNPLIIVPLFVVFGLLLSFTPCVLPMVPILSSIILGEGKVSRAKGFTLAAVYALGMATVYTAFGVVAGLLGEGLAAALQTPWVLLTFAALLIGLSLSMFGFYELQLPSSVQTKLTEASGKMQGGKLFGVFVMGGLSALVVGPCVAAPLAGTLVFISQTKNAVTGGLALFSLAVGMSVPLLLVGLSAGSLLPRAGAWMERVKRFFGVMLIATALWMASPVLPVWAVMTLWALLLLVCATYLRVFDSLADGANGWSLLFKGFGVVLALAGAALLVGVASGGRELLQPLAHLAGAGRGGAAKAGLTFEKVKDVAELQQRVAAAGAAGKTVMLDFYADWCVSCKEMEQFTFSDAQVQAKLANVVLLKADVTANNAADKALLKRFNLFGPPGIIFFNAKGDEIGRVIGYQAPERFLQSLSVI